MHTDIHLDTSTGARSGTQVPSAGRGGLGNIRTLHADLARSSSPLGALLDSDQVERLERLLDPANFALLEAGQQQADGSSEILDIRASPRTSPSTASFSTSSGLSLSAFGGRHAIAPSILSVTASVGSGSSHSRSLSDTSSSARSMAASRVSLDTTASTSNASSIDIHVVHDPAHDPNQCADCALARSARLASLPHLRGSSPPRSASSLSMFSMRTFGSVSASGSGSRAGSGSSKSALSLGDTDGKDKDKHHESAADTYARHLHTDAHARDRVRAARRSKRRTQSGSALGPYLGRVDEERYDDHTDESEDDSPRSPRGGKVGFLKANLMGRKSSKSDAPVGKIVVVRTGRGGSGGVFRADDSRAVDAGMYPTTAALAAQHAALRHAQEQQLITASRVASQAVRRSGRGGSGNTKSAASKKKPKAKRKEEPKDAAKEMKLSPTKTRKALKRFFSSKELNSEAKSSAQLGALRGGNVIPGSVPGMKARPPESQIQGSSSVPDPDIYVDALMSPASTPADDLDTTSLELSPDMLRPIPISPSHSTTSSTHHSHAEHRVADGLPRRADVPTPLESLYESEDESNSDAISESDFGSDVGDEDASPGTQDRLALDGSLLDVSSVTAEIDKFVIRGRDRDSVRDDGASLAVTMRDDESAYGYGLGYGYGGVCEQYETGQGADPEPESESDVDPSFGLGSNSNAGDEGKMKAEDVHVHRCARVDAGGGDGVNGENETRQEET